jgi:anti-anti-sigma regulatory factor
MAVSIVFREGGPGTRILAIAGEVDISTSALLTAAIRNSLSDPKVRNLVVDLQNLTL